MKLGWILSENEQYFDLLKPCSRYPSGHFIVLKNLLKMHFISHNCLTFWRVIVHFDGRSLVGKV